LEFVKLYFQHLGFYDYIGLGFVGIVFLLLFILSLILLFKKPLLGFILFIISLFVLPIGIYGVQIFANKTIRKSSFIIKEAKPLHFSNSLLLEANIKNDSKTDFKICLIRIKIVKKSKSKIKDFLYSLKPFALKTIYLHEPIQRHSSYTLKKILDDVVYTDNDKLISKIACY